MPVDELMVDVSSDWMAACEVQQRFMRVVTSNDALDISAQCRQVRELGGDFYDYVPAAGGRVAFAIGDASGKGLPAALMIANVQSSLRTAALFAGEEASEAIGAVNRQVFTSSLANRYATVFYGVFEPATRILRYVNAGHQPPMIVRRDGTVTWLETGGAPVGLFADWTYEEGVVRLEPGDVLVACTDGITEAADAAGEDWGVDGLQRAVEDCRDAIAGEMVQAIFGSLDQFMQGRQSDDATVLALRVR
ncbi:MAG TPA: PP2C family protein-serine/threonine phosphatase [Bryobacteraceae bacterium]|nr:PP2C family protein-serine/threonine phosphatase [Bryobacteraceae bacterium]